MSKVEIKSEINKVLDTLPDKALEDLLSFLKNIGDKGSKSLDTENLLTKILAEDNILLKRLAH